MSANQLSRDRPRDLNQRSELLLHEYHLLQLRERSGF